MLVIQGKNDPRVIERESRDLVERMRGQGKQVEYLMFEMKVTTCSSTKTGCVVILPSLIF